MGVSCSADRNIKAKITKEGVFVEDLDEGTLVEILTRPKNALVRQYKKLFEMEGADLDFTPSALALIAKMAKEPKKVLNAYEIALAARFVENFKKFETGCPPEVIKAGPKV